MNRSDHKQHIDNPFFQESQPNINAQFPGGNSGPSIISNRLGQRVNSHYFTQVPSGRATRATALAANLREGKGNGGKAAAGSCAIAAGAWNNPVLWVPGYITMTLQVPLKRNCTGKIIGQYFFQRLCIVHTLKNLHDNV